MKKSSLGRKSGVAVANRKTSDFSERNSGIPVFSRSSSTLVPNVTQMMPRKRDLSADRVSTSKRRDPSADRMSELTTPRCSNLRTPRQLTMSSGRPSSISCKKGDIRPLTDKEWQKTALDTVLSALNMSQEGYNILQNYKSLKPMSLAMFADICNFLLRQLDRKVELTKVNYVTELPFLLKKLKYKGKMDKSLLQTVNTPHTWPNVLGILHFLSELVMAAEDFKANSNNCMYPDSYEIEDSETEELNFKYIVPLLNHLWGYVGKQEEYEIEQLLKNNSDMVNHALEASGYTHELFEKEAEKKRLYEEAEKKKDEALEKLYKAELQYKAASDKLNRIHEKQDTLRNEISDLKREQQDETDKLAELDNKIRYMEEEMKAKQGILDQFEGDNMTPDEYEKYEVNKQNKLEELTHLKNGNMILEEVLLDNQVNTQELKHEQMKLIKKYNSDICKLMEDNISFKNVLSHSKPRIGDVPFDEATEKFFEEAVKSYKEKVEAAQKELENSSGDFLAMLQLSEEIQCKEALLLQLESIGRDQASQHEKKKIELQKQLTELTQKEDELNRRILAAQEDVKKNNEKYDELETESTNNESRLKKFSEICQKRLDLQYQVNVELNQKVQADEDEIKKAFQDALS